MSLLIQFSFLCEISNKGKRNKISLNSCMCFTIFPDFNSYFYFSAQMVLMWFVGDSFKTIYFIVRDSPLQFLMCGSIQTFVDVLILFQVVSYDKTPERIK